MNDMHESRKIAFLIYNKGSLCEVAESFKLSTDKIIGFIGSDENKLPNGTILEDHEGKKWRILSYLHTTPSFEGYQKIKEQEERFIFQYQLEGIGHEDKPDSGDKLKITKTTRRHGI